MGELCKACLLSFAKSCAVLLSLVLEFIYSVCGHLISAKRACGYVAPMCDAVA